MTLANRSLLALVWIPLALGLLTAACGDDRSVQPTGADSAPSGNALGPGITIADAVTSKLDGPLLVNGWLWRQSTGEVRLCTTLSDATPPGCGEPSLAVVGLDVNSLPNLRSERGTTTSSTPAQVLGIVARGVITVARNVAG